MIPCHSYASQKTFNAIAAPFPPLISPALENNGWLWEICSEAFRSQGYTTTLTFVPWARAIKEAQYGQYDALLPTYWTQERSQWFHYSSPLEILRTGFFKHKDREDLIFTGDLNTLTDYTIGVGRAYSVSDTFDQAHYLNKHSLTNNVMSLKMLWEKRLDLIVGDELVELYNVKTISKDPHFSGIQEDIVFMEPPLQVRSLYMAISKNTSNSVQKLDDFEQGLRHLIDSGEYHKILGKHGVKPRNKVTLIKN